MIGIGAIAAGYVPAGGETTADQGSARNVRLPSAVKFDPSTGDVPRDTATGLYEATHPVDQRVTLALGVALGKLALDKTLGSRLLTLQPAAQERMTALALGHVEEALANLITAGDITLLSVSTKLSAHGRIVVEVQYVNLRLPDGEPQTVQRTVT